MIGVKVTDELKRAIEKAAAQEHRTMSGYIRHCILVNLENIGIDIEETDETDADD